MRSKEHEHEHDGRSQEHGHGAIRYKSPTLGSTTGATLLSLYHDYGREWLR